MQKRFLSKIKTLWLGTGIKKIVTAATIVLTAIVICAFAIASLCATATHRQSVLKSCENYTRFVKIGLEAELKSLTNSLSVYINEPLLNSNETLYVNGVLNSSLTDKILKKLRTTAASNSLIKDIAVTFYDYPIVLSQRGYFSAEYMRNTDESIFVANDFDFQDHNIVYMQTEASSKNSTQPHSLYLYFVSDQYRVTISVDVNSFISRFNKTKFYDDSSTILVMHSSKKIILTNDYEKSMNLDRGKLFETNSLRFSADHLIVKEKGENALTYFVLFDKSVIKKDISSVNKYYVSAYFIILIVLLAFLYLLYNILVIPLKRFANNFLSISGSSKKNEFAALLDYVEIMNEQLFEMSDYILYTKDTTNNGMMINAILTGSADKSSHEYNTYKNNFFRDAFPYSKFMLMYIITGTADKSASTGLAVALDALNVKYEFCFIAEDGFFAVINYSGSEDIIKRGIGKYIDDCNKSRVHVAALISDPVDSVDSIWQCTNQLSSLKTDRNIKNKSKLYTQEDTAPHKPIMATFVNNEATLMNHISDGDTSKLKIYLSSFFKNDERYSYSDAYSFFMYLYNFIIRASYRYSGDLQQSQLPYSEMMSKGNLSVIDFDALRNSFCETCIILCENASTYNNDYEDEVIRFIKDNYNKFISLDIVAQKFNLNPSYLSTYIKKKIGMSFVEYMRILRIGNAKKLLTETDLDISEISEALGFTDTSSFIRYFKKSENSTPKQYRTAHKKGR